MKKILSLTAALLAMLMLASCTNGSNNTGTDTTDSTVTTTAPTDTTAEPSEDTTIDTTEATELAYKDATELLTLIWNDFSEDQKFFIGGGNSFNPDTMVQDAPGKFVALADTDYDSNLGYPAADVAKIDDAASFFHGMNVNTFTCAAYHFVNADDISGMVDAIKTNILARQWMCGFPEKLVIITLPGNYVISMWGVGEGCVDLFASKTVALIDGAEIVVDQTIEA